MTTNVRPDHLKVKLLSVKNQYGQIDYHLESSHGPIGSVVNLSYAVALDLIHSGQAVEVKP